MSRGRNLKEIDWSTVDKLCMIDCTKEEVASVLDVDADTLNSACKREKDMLFSAYYEKKRLTGNASLRRMQWKLCEAGNPTMLIWKGKQRLGQTDKIEEKTEITGNIQTQVDFSKLTEEQRQLARKLLEKPSVDE